MRSLLDPLMQRFGERLAHNPFAPVSRRVAATEMGGLLGYLAQRVLGQYDLLVRGPDRDHRAGPNDAPADAVYYVGANILVAREALRVPARSTSACGSRSTR